MNGVQDLLLNVLFILLPIFCYQTIWGDRRNNAAIIGMAAVAELLCMTFPVGVYTGFYFDLRAVPLLLGIFYGGRYAAIPLGLIIFAYRWYLGGDGLVFVLISFPVMIIAAYAMMDRFTRSNRLGKAVLACSILLVETLLWNGLALWKMGLPPLENPMLPMMGLFLALQVCCLWQCVFFVENVREKLILRAEVQRSEKSHVLGELAASIAHEVRNPLTVVRGFLQLLGESKISEEKRQLFLNMSIEELDRAESIISGYLSFARPKLRQWVPVDVAERVRHAAEIIGSFALLRNVEIHPVCEDDLQVLADPEKVSQVLMNLIKNGVEAMPDGGRIQLFAYRRHHHVIIDVIDNGCGMTAEQAASIGNPYYSTKDKGTGLGLMVCHQIIHAMNGTINVQSVLGSGTQFSISIPALQEAHEQA